ncbi:MAG: hypothetical protein U9O41_07160, partial [Candidatus Aerophobetes bacterium]|nr:hypothetical protein [Candidatus Aerophobetes bacterium]
VEEKEKDLLFEEQSDLLCLPLNWGEQHRREGGYFPLQNPSSLPPVAKEMSRVIQSEYTLAVRKKSRDSLDSISTVNIILRRSIR